MSVEQQQEHSKLYEHMVYWHKQISEHIEDEWSDNDLIIDGLRHCCECKTAKERRVELPTGESFTHAVYCEHILKEKTKVRDEIAAQEAIARIERRRKEGLRTEAAYKSRFDIDVRPDSQVTKFMKGYIAKWDQMKMLGAGLLLTGGVGTGKSFYACAIAHEVISLGDRAYFITVPELVRVAWNKDEFDHLLNKFDTYELIILDDLGAERDTDYAIEQVFQAVDRRMASRKPMIVTTNLSLAEMKNRPTLQSQRIYDRIDQMCPLPFEFRGESLRKSKGEEVKNEAIELLKKGIASL